MTVMDILEQVKQLKPEERQTLVQEILSLIVDDPRHSFAGFNYDEWFAYIEAIREDIRQSHGGIFPQIDAISILRDIRNGEDDEPFSTLDELLDGITPENLHGEIGTGNPVGKEVW